MQDTQTREPIKYILFNYSLYKIGIFPLAPPPFTTRTQKYYYSFVRRMYGYAVFATVTICWN